MNALRVLSAVAIGPPDAFGVTARAMSTAERVGLEAAPSASATTSGPRTAPAGTRTTTRCSAVLAGSAVTSSPLAFAPMKVTEAASRRWRPSIERPEPARTVVPAQLVRQPTRVTPGTGSPDAPPLDASAGPAIAARAAHAPMAAANDCAVVRRRAPGGPAAGGKALLRSPAY